MDKVILTNESWGSLMRWRDKNRDLVLDYHPVIREGKISKNGHDMFFKIHDDEYVVIEIIGLFRCLLEFVPNKGYIIRKVEYGNDEVIKDTVTVYFTVMAYIYHFKPEIEVREFRKHNGGKTRRISRSSHTVTLKRTVYIMPDHIKATRRPPQRYTESWAVRGHPRRLKSGKVVPVKPYTKGNGKIADKEYRLEDV